MTTIILRDSQIISDDLIKSLDEGEMSLAKLHREVGGSKSNMLRRIAKMVKAGVAPDSLLRFASIRTEYDALPSVSIDASMSKLRSVGYNTSRAELTPAEAWNEQKIVFERTLASTCTSDKRGVLKNPNGTGAFVLAHFTDCHLDDDGAALLLLEQDIKASRDMGSLMIHGGDALNNWPTAGKLARKWAEQDCSQPRALMLLEHYISLLGPNVWIDGNHEEMGGSYLDQLIVRALPHGVVRDYWTATFNVETRGARILKAAVSHRFQKGNSWFHRLHGHLREMLEGADLDLMMDGHLHSAGVMEHHLPERGHSALLVASAGYKVVDRYAARISRGGKDPKLAGRAHWVVCDPQADRDASFLQAFRCPRQAEAYVSGLQNLRAA